MRQRSLVCALILMLLYTTIGLAADRGDPVYHTGTNELDVPSLKQGGDQVLTIGNAGAKYAPVLVATTDNIQFTAEQLIDGVQTAGSRVLVWQQTDDLENGLYVSGETWIRAPDANTGAELASNLSVYVQSGLTYAEQLFTVTTIAPVTLGTTPITWICSTCGIGGGATPTQQEVHEVSTTADWTDLPEAHPLRTWPSGSEGVKLELFGRSGDVVEECFTDSFGLEPCSPKAETLYPGRLGCSLWVVVNEPAERLCLVTVENLEVGGIGTDILFSDRGPFVGRPTAIHTHETYIVTDCLTDACTAGGGTIWRQQGWDGDSWENIGATAAGGSGDIEAVWGCATGDCSTLTAASGDSLDAGSATSSRPSTRSTSLPGTCSEGEFHQDTDSGGTETYVCTATNTWTKFAPERVWHLDWSAAGAHVDGTNCTYDVPDAINAGPMVAPILCLDQPGTIQFSFNTPARYDGGALTVCFEVNDRIVDGQVWDADVITQFRATGSVVNNTWSSPVAAAATLTTAHASYFACATGTPNGAAAGIGRVYVKATIDNAGGHTEIGSARVLGGYVTGQ